MHEEIGEQQADITRLLLHHIHAPLAGTQLIRGVLPVPPPAEAIRIVTGSEHACAPDELIAYEIPLRTDDGLLTAYDIIGILRSVLTGTHFHPNDRVSTMMGMRLVRVEQTDVEPAADTPDDNALRILRTIACPFIEDQSSTRLRGFLFTGQDRFRLYLDTTETPGVVATDVRLSGAITALTAALPSLITEEERWTADDSDPHCSRAVDLTHW
ncbi:hypothetical protein [Streptomyces cinnamoneus]|uniref:Uncharacterized protein n=1 Tax=Streptomyces cinnamoneus TaxID=53446 RepID=A0A918TG87_STRCJ|nr:hypothetical protein [Streptomyces cinnamoneus]GHC45432.1 hypothetical protein GCM10010507_20880 [Streptomyces cinnamoneus]